MAQGRKQPPLPGWMARCVFWSAVWSGPCSCLQPDFTSLPSFCLLCASRRALVISSPSWVGVGIWSSLCKEALCFPGAPSHAFDSSINASLVKTSSVIPFKYSPPLFLILAHSYWISYFVNICPLGYLLSIIISTSRRAGLHFTHHCIASHHLRL